MRRRTKRLGRDEKGQNLVELAIVVPLLLLIVGGIFDLGRAMNNYIIITNAAREGARFASRFPIDITEPVGDRIKQATIDEAASSGVVLQPSDITIIGMNASAGMPIEVQIERDFPTFLSSITGVGEITLRARAEMIIFGYD